MNQKVAGRLPKSAYSSRKSGSSGNGIIIMLTIAAMVVSTVSMYSIIIILFGMLPGLIAMIVDQEPKRYISKIVLSFNTLGLAPFIMKIVSSSSANSIAIELIISPKTWLIIYSATAVGWAVYWIFPQVAAVLFDMKTQLRTKQLHYELNALADEWGDDIKASIKND